jgi:hypothetical protein
VRVMTRRPDLLFWDKANFVHIMSKTWTEAHNAQLPAKPEELATAYPNMHANGTGPFMLESFAPGRELWSMLVCGVQAATCSSAACTGSPSRKRTPWITWASRCEPSNRRQLRSAALASL